MIDYIEFITDKLKPKIINNLPLVIDLFAGCGGLSLGFEANGFRTIGYEMNENASNTYNYNLTGRCITKKLEIGEDYPSAKIIIGGPPCQPFSVRGSQKGLKDSRDGFPIFIDAVDRLQPEIWMFENVRGMLYKNKEYFDEIVVTLQNLGYNIYFELFNAVDFQVPQNRERVIVVGSKKDYRFPKRIFKKITVGDAISSIIEEPAEKKLFLTPSMDEYIKKYEIASKCINPRDLYLDKPARTLTCRNLAGATSDMQRVVLNSGKRRMLTIKEAARLQSFPDWFHFCGPEGEQYKQIGNAVAPMLSYHFANSIKEYILQDGVAESSNKHSVQMALF
jgi:DNA (cytosine-5)-methyltransferase 1